jgi:hypothetical protein
MSDFFFYARVVPANLRASCFNLRVCMRFPLDNRASFFPLNLSFLIAMETTPSFETNHQPELVGEFLMLRQSIQGRISRTGGIHLVHLGEEKTIQLK